MVEQEKSYSKKEKGVSAVFVPIYSTEIDLDVFFQNLPDFVEKVVFLIDNKDLIPKINKYQKPSVYCDNIYLKGFEDTKYNYADRIVFDKNKEEAEASLLDYSILSNNDDFIIVLEVDKVKGLGQSISIGGLWAKTFGIDSLVVLPPKSNLDRKGIENLFNNLKEKKYDVVLGRNQNIRRTVGEGFYLFLKSFLMSLASGYWKASFIFSSSIGFSRKALTSISFYKMKTRNGYLTDLLIKANLGGCRFKEIFVNDKGPKKAALNQGVLVLGSRVILFGFFKRLWGKYLIKDFHPLFLFYNMTLVLFGFSIYYFFKIFQISIFEIREVNKMTIFSLIFFIVSFIQAFAFSIWMDIMDNKQN